MMMMMIMGMMMMIISMEIMIVMMTKITVIKMMGGDTGMVCV